MTKEMLHQLVEETCLRMFGCELREATEKQAYRALCVTVRMMLEDRQRAFQAETREKERKQVYYMSMEFLVGTSLRNNLFNLGLYNEADEVLTELGFSLSVLWKVVPMLGVIFAVSFAAERGTDVARWLCERKWLVQFLILFAALLTVVLFVYGNAGYTPIAYVYENV